MTDASELPPFRPPYVLAGSCLALVGVWDRDVHAPPDGFRPVRLFGRTAAVVIANHYTEPPAEMPLRYREVIAASLVRRGLEVAAVPFDMVLDQQLPVDLGRQHYALPKRLDTTFVVDESARAFNAHAHDLALEARTHGVVASVFAVPIRIAFALAVRAITASIDVLGDAGSPHERARIKLRPRGIGRSMRVTACTSRGVALRTVWCQSWSWTSTWLGPPSPLERRDSNPDVENPDAPR
ncbi:MAG: hypothetical protein JWP87_6431 [Labilithrix sp.]|nr:hypothetical protein [Labilithrix sp.]